MTEHLNPYIAGAPVTDARMFFGREDVFEWIEHNLAGQYADHILVVHGQRRVGKTSVLRQLPAHLPSRYIPVFFDLQGRTHTTLDRFLWWLSREIVRVLKQDRELIVPLPAKDAFVEDPDYLESQFLPGLRSNLGGHILLLTFDEFDCLEEAEIRDTLGRPLVDYLRRLMSQPGLNFIFSIGSSGRKLENMQASYTEFFKAALYKKISFLQRRDAENLIAGPVRGVLEYERAAVDEIFRITSGHPYFTQLICHELFARCLKTDARRVRRDDVLAVQDDVVERGTVNLKFVWDEASDLERWCLAGLAHLDGDAELHGLGEFLRAQRVRFSDPDLESSLTHLREKDVLTSDNRFVIDLLRLWLRENRPIERVREELTEINPIASRFVEIGLEFKDRGLYDKALENFGEALDVDGDNLQARVSMALVHLERNSLDRAVAEFQKALVIDDEDVRARTGLCEAHLALGDLAAGKGKTREAIQSYERVLAINTEHTEARQRMADIHGSRAEKALSEGRGEEGLAAFTEALRFTPEDQALASRYAAARQEWQAQVISSLMARAEREQAARNWDQAIAALQEALDLTPGETDLQARLADARRQQREAHLADLESRAQALATSERWDEAIAAWGEILTLEPQRPDAVKQEIRQLEQASAIAGSYAEAQGALARKDYDQAVRLFKEIIVEDETYKEAMRFLAEAIRLRRRGMRFWQKPALRVGSAAILGLAALASATYLAWNQLGRGTPAPTGPSPPPTLGVSMSGISAITPLIVTPAAPTHTSAPTLTATSVPSWVADFAEPILDAVENRTPDFQDDFTSPNLLWSWPGFFDGRIENPGADYPSVQVRNKVFRDFVETVDLTVEEPGGVVQFWWYGSLFMWRLDLFTLNPGAWGWEVRGCSSSSCEPGASGVTSTGSYPTVHILLIKHNSQFAVYLDDQPLAHITPESPNLKYFHEIWLSPSQPERWGIIRLDNVRIWEISDIPELP